eukprot:g9822.t1
MNSVPKGDGLTDLGRCSYLVVGAGAPALAFIDTLITLNEVDEKITKDAPIVLIDRHDAPGGHWNDAYEFVRLHNPSLVYGVSSKQLEGSWLTQNLLKLRLPTAHRATKHEILAYYSGVLKTWKEKGLVKFFGGVEFDFQKAKGNLDRAEVCKVWSSESEVGELEDARRSSGSDSTSGSSRTSKFGNPNTLTTNTDTIVAADAELPAFDFVLLQNRNARFQVSVAEKLVNATLGENIVPTANNMPFRVEGQGRIEVRVPSELHTLPPSSFASKKFCILGGGKTGMDALVWLQRDKGVGADRISWVTGTETWMLNRERLASPGVLADAVLDAMLNAGGPEETGYLETALTELERSDLLRSIDGTGAHRPTDTDFRFPITDLEELSYLRKPQLVKHRQGHVAKLSLDDDGGVRLHFKARGTRTQTSLEDESVTPGAAEEVVFIHCTAPGPFTGRQGSLPLYQGKYTLNLMNTSPPPRGSSTGSTQSGSVLAWVETGRRLNAAQEQGVGERGALRESVEMICNAGHDARPRLVPGERGDGEQVGDVVPEVRNEWSAEENLAKLIRPDLVATPENFAHVWNSGVLNCLEFGKRSADGKFPSYRAFLDGNRLMTFGPLPIRRRHLETMEKLEAAMSKRKFAMTFRKNGVDGAADLGAVRSLVAIMMKKGLRGS